LLWLRDLGDVGPRTVDPAARCENQPVTDDRFLNDVTEKLAALTDVEAVALGGSRADGTQRPDSDWDFAIYYRGSFDPAELREIGWSGKVFEVGGWGGGVFNGGAWLQIDGRKVDVHYRDLDGIDHELQEAAGGRFRIEPLLFHVAGIPSYLVVAELSVNRVLRGQIPKSVFPPALSRAAKVVWTERAELIFDYARDNQAARGQLTQCLGLVAEAVTCSAHAILAARAEWVTNEKRILFRAGLSEIDQILARIEPEPQDLVRAVHEARELCRLALSGASRG
jgi:hypothetical protein